MPLAVLGVFSLGTSGRRAGNSLPVRIDEAHFACPVARPLEYINNHPRSWLAVTDEELGVLLEVAGQGWQRVRNQFHLMAAGEYGPVVLMGKLVNSGSSLAKSAAAGRSGFPEVFAELC